MEDEELKFVMNNVTNVLIVEDLPTDAEIAEHEVRRVLPDCKFLRVETRDDFIAALTSFNPDVIISDYKLPQFDGISALKIALEKVPEVPFIIVTGSMNEDTAVECMKAGAWDYVIKEHVKRLGTAVMNSLEQKRLRLERKQMDEKLRESEEQLRLALDAANTVAWVWKCNDNKITSIGPVAKMFGKPAGFRHKDLESFLRGIHPDDRESVLAVLRSGAQRKKQKDSIEFRILLADGSNRWLEMTGRFEYDPEGRLAHVRGIMCDITERKQMEKQERLSTLGQMASGIAHDFNNVLVPIIGFSELLLADSTILDDRKELRHTIDMILSAGQDARKIVSRLRAIYRGDEDDNDYRMIEISKIVESAISLTMSRWKEEMSAKGVTIEIKTDFDPVPQIKGNESEIREALTNLIFNAVDAMPKGGVITFRSFRKEGDSIVLEMTDTGFGMEEKTLRRCLEPFFTTKGIHGSGLGLAMVYGIVKRHGGTVEIESKLGVGTTVRILFPVPVNVENTNEQLKDKLEPLSPIRIIVIDDEERSRDLLARLLKADGHHVELAEWGRPGLDMLRKAKYDLIITDRAMPKISGDQVAKEAQKIQPGIPVIMVTGFGDIMKDRDEHPSGIARVISKPVMQQELRHVIASVMSALQVARGSTTSMTSRSPVHRDK